MGKTLNGTSKIYMCSNHIENKTYRRIVVSKEKREKKKLKKLAKIEKKERKEEAERQGIVLEKPITRTIENTREKDDTVLDPANEENAERIEEMNFDLETDEYESYFNMKYEPKVLITVSDVANHKTRMLAIELSLVIPNSAYFPRKKTSIKKIVETAIPKKFTDIIVINEDRRKPNALLLTHLPDGPTAYFRLSNVKTSNELFGKRSWDNITDHRPELILNNFTTRLGLTIGRMFNGVFHHDPEYKGRRVATFHNQRDYIFFRHHRYDFSLKAKAKLKELGPRFTMRLQTLQKGTFDSKFGEFIWSSTGRMHEMTTSRRRFFL